MRSNHSRVAAHLLIVLVMIASVPVLLAGQRGGGGGGTRGAPRGGQPARPSTPTRGPQAPRGNTTLNGKTVDITRTDGTNLRLEIMSFDVDRITGKNPGDQGQFESIKVSWYDVIRTSNANLTYQKVLNEWKREHRAELCPTCAGNRVVFCDVCKGTYRDPHELPLDCKTCAGALLIKCKAPRCENGKIPCTHTNCLSLNDGPWVTRPGQTGRFKGFKYNAGTTWVDESKLGHIITVNAANGQVQDAGLCPECNGTTLADCPACDGWGKVPCQTCSSLRKIPLCPSDCEKGHMLCATCGGTGIRPRTLAAGLPEATQPAIATAAPASTELMYSLSQ
jgi:hypothetical protein